MSNLPRYGDKIIDEGQATLEFHQYLEDLALGSGDGPTVTSGSGAPSSTPGAVGDIYIDTTGDVSWSATGTASSADWKQATGAGGGDLLAANNLSDVASAATSRTNLDVDQAGTDNSTNVTLVGSGTYLSIIGQAITVDPITESDVSDLGNYAVIGGAYHDGFSDFVANEHADITGTVEVTGNWTFNDVGDGGITSYDIEIGDTDGSPTYGIARFGNSIMGRTSYNSGNLDIDGCMLFRNVGAPATSNIETLWVDGSNDIRFALAVSGIGNATYNPRSMLIAGPSVLDDTVVTVGYWQGQGIFDNLVCNTSGDGADLGVQNDLEVEGDIFVDSILESTTAAGVTIDGLLIKDSGIPEAAVTAHEGAIDHDQLTNFTSTEHFTQAAISIPLSQISDVTSTAAEVNLLDLSGLTVGWVLAADSATTASWQAPTGGSGDEWGDVVDADIIPDGDGTRDLGSTGTRFAETYTDALAVTGNITVGGTVDGIDIATDVAANTAKVTNATHTGDVTGDTALTIANDAVDIAMLSATGTPSSSTYLRGDNTWATPAGGGGAPTENVILTATKTSGQNINGVEGTETDLTWDVVAQDTGELTSFSTGDAQVVFTNAGWVNIHASGIILNGVVNNRSMWLLSLYHYDSGDSLKYSYHGDMQYNRDDAAGYDSSGGSVGQNMMYVAAGDYIYVRFRVCDDGTSGTSQTLDTSYSKLRIAQIGF